MEHMSTTDIITNDPRFRATGIGATDTILALLEEHLSHDEVLAIGLASNFRVNMDRERPSDALRAAARCHLAKTAR